MIRPSRRDLRLTSGLVLFAYVTLHLIDHALGLVSLDAAEAGLRVTVALWHSAPGSLLLYGAAATHIALAFVAVYERRTLRMPPLQALRIALGLWMPVVLLTHFTGTRIAFERYGLASDYARVVTALWTPGGQGRQLALLAPGWLHGCLGLRFAFGRRRWFAKAQPLLFGAALLLPVLAGLGFLVLGRQLAEHAPLVIAATPQQGAALGRLRDELLAAYLGAIALVLAAREVRALVERQRKSVFAIDYPARRVHVPHGWSVLEASRAYGIAHASVCGGRARCSTCRVRVVAGLEHCPAAEADERRTLARLQAGEDLRLACQLRPRGDVGVVPLVAPAPGEGRAATTERRLAILAADFRRAGATPIGQRSAHDTVYALDLFHEALGDAVEAQGGALCAHGGAGAIAVFGLHGELDDACRRALAAARQLERIGVQLNRRLAIDLAAQGELALALHAGMVVLGQVGAREAKRLTALGASVEAARRLRADGCVVSEAVLDALGLVPADASSWRIVEAPGESETPLRALAAASVEACLAAARPAASRPGSLAAASA